MLRQWIVGGVCALAGVAFLTAGPDRACAWNHHCCDNGRYYLGGNGYRGCGCFVCGEHFSGGWQGGPNGGFVGLGYTNTAYYGTLGDVKAGRIAPMGGRIPAPTRPYSEPMKPVPPVPGTTPTTPPTPVPPPAPAY